MTEEGPLDLRADFFGADEAITNFEPDKDPVGGDSDLSRSKQTRGLRKTKPQHRRDRQTLGAKKCPACNQLISGDLVSLNSL